MIRFGVPSCIPDQVAWATQFGTPHPGAGFVGFWWVTPCLHQETMNKCQSCCTNRGRPSPGALTFCWSAARKRNISTCIHRCPNNTNKHGSVYPSIALAGGVSVFASKQRIVAAKHHNQFNPKLVHRFIMGREGWFGVTTWFVFSASLHILLSNFCGVCVLIPFLQEINVQKFQGPDNPTSQLLPIMSFKGCSGGEGRKDKGGGEGSRSWVTKWSCSERWCV